MPTQYSLTCHIDQRWVKEWGGDGSPMKFCFAASMNDENRFDVVAYAEVVSGSITVEWVEDYYIAAAKHSFKNGVKITSATNFTPVDFGQGFKVDKSWTDSDAATNPRAPSNGFFFQNVNTPASAVVAKKINGQVKPFYITPILLPPSGTTGGGVLIPTPSVAVWFQMDIDDGIMVESEMSEKYIVKMDVPNRKATFSQAGEWGGGKFVND